MWVGQLYLFLIFLPSFLYQDKKEGGVWGNAPRLLQKAILVTLINTEVEKCP